MFVREILGLTAPCHGMTTRKVMFKELGGHCIGLVSPHTTCFDT